MKQDTPKNLHPDSQDPAAPTSAAGNAPVDETEIQPTFIPKLPKHLKKGFFAGIDLRFAAILGFSIFLNLLIFYILYQNTSFEHTSEDISRLQNNYAKLILDKEPITPEKEAAQISSGRVEAPAPTKVRKPAVEETKPVEEKQIDERRGKRRRSRRERNRQNEMDRSPEDELAGESEEGSSRSAIIAKVNDMGLLEYMKHTVLTSDVDDDFLIYTDAINNNLLRMLDGIDAEEMVDASRAQSEAQDELAVQLKDALPMQRTSGSKRVEDLFGSNAPLEEAQAIPIDKIEHYEKIPEPLDALGRRRTRKVHRTAHEISAVIRHHNRAVQDCYKQALRKDSSLKGKVIVQFAISPRGRVTFVNLVSSTISSDAMIRCLLNKIRRWNDFGICEEQAKDVKLKQSYVFGY